jgi:pimeloyl-ACP methyl ester carboxylesterase
LKLILLVFGFDLLLTAAVDAAAGGKDISREQHWVVTEERFELAVERFRLAGKSRSQPPVILSHGIFVNSRFFNLTEEQSLARDLASDGLDVWNLSLRGNGRSLNPLKGGSKSWSLDDILARDVKAVISYVVSETRSQKTAWVAYGSGGLLPYGYLGKNRDPRLGALVTIGAPVTFNHPEQEFLKTFLMLNDYPWLKQLSLRLDWPSVGSFLLGLVPSLQNGFYNHENIDGEIREKLLAEALARINPGVLEQLLLIIKQGEFVAATGDFKYRDALRKIELPVLLIGGEQDAFAPPEALRLVHRSLGAGDRTIKIFGAASKDAAPYGHFDLVLGKTAPREIFPVISEWLKQKSRRR